MNITFNTLPDLIIQEILTILELNDQAKLQYCNRRIGKLLKYIVFEEVKVPKNDDDLKNMAYQIGKYVKRLDGNVDKSFFKVKDQFPKLERIEVGYYIKHNVFDQLRSLDIKLKSFALDLSEPFPIQPQFNFNHIIENLIELHMTIKNEAHMHLNMLEMVQIPNLKILWLFAYYFPEDTLVNINRNFPNLKVLRLIKPGYLPELITPTTFLKLKKLILNISVTLNIHQLPFQSFPQLKALEFSKFVFPGENGIKIIEEKLFNQLLAVEMKMTKFSNYDVLNFQNLKYAKLKLNESFDAESMQYLLALPKLRQLSLRKNVSDNLFENVSCKSPLCSLTFLDSATLSFHFLKFLQFAALSLTNLKFDLDFGISAFKIGTFNNLNNQTSLKLLFLEVSNDDKEFVNWIKAQSPDVYVTYPDWG